MLKSEYWMLYIIYNGVNVIMYVCNANKHGLSDMCFMYAHSTMDHRPKSVYTCLILSVISRINAYANLHITDLLNSNPTYTINNESLEWLKFGRFGELIKFAKL